MAKRIFLFFAMLAYVLLLGACMSRMPTPPDSTEPTALSLPFPLTDVPMGLVSADMEITWNEHVQKYYNVYYRGRFSADYHMRFLGDGTAMVRIAVPLLAQGGRQWFPEDSGREFRIYIDGEPAEFHEYLMTENIARDGPGNLAGHQTPVLEGFIDHMRGHWAGKYYFPAAFEADEPAVLYRFSAYVPRGSGMTSPVINFRYNPARTTVISRFSRMMVIHSERLPGQTRVHFVGEAAELLVIGEDTLTWEYETRFFDRWDWVTEEIKSELREAFVLDVEIEEITPREYLRQVQSTRFFLRFRPQRGNEHVDPDLLMGYVDGVLAASGHLTRFAALDRFREPPEPNVIVVAMPFAPGQERVISISHDVFAGKEWDRRAAQSLFHYTILTEAADYWEFAGHMTVTAHHPENMIRSEYTDGFDVFDGKSVIHLQNPGENIHIGFWLEDGRPDHRSGGINLAGLVLLLLVFLAVFVLLPIVIVSLVWRAIRRSIMRERVKKDE